MRWALVALLLASVATPASACPTGSEVCKPFAQIAEEQSIGYVRTVAGLPESESYADVVRFLTASAWRTWQIASTGRDPESRTVRFADPGAPLDASILRGRTIFVTRVGTLPPGRTSPNDRIVVEIDGSSFVLEACGPARRSACLVLHGPAKSRISIAPARE